MNSASRVTLVTILMLIGVAPRAHAESDQYYFDYVRSVEAQLQRATAATCNVQEWGWSSNMNFAFCHDRDAAVLAYVKNQHESQLRLCEINNAAGTPGHLGVATATDFKIAGETAVDAYSRPTTPTAKASVRSTTTQKTPVAAVPGKITSPSLNAEGNEAAIEPLDLSDGKISSQGGTSKSTKSSSVPSSRAPVAAQPAAKSVPPANAMKLAADRIGPDYRHFAAANAEKCRKQCSAEMQCRAWTFVKQDASCHLQNQAPKVMGQNACCESGVK